MRLRLPDLIQPSARRDWVTPEDVNVSPALLGHALARPSQRAWAMALDLALIALASSLGNWMLLGGVALAAWLQIRRRDGKRPPARLWWLPVLLLLTLGLQSLWTDLRESLQDSTPADHPARTVPAEPTPSDSRPALARLDDRSHDQSDDRSDAQAARDDEAPADSALADAAWTMPSQAMRRELSRHGGSAASAPDEAGAIVTDSASSASSADQLRIAALEAQVRRLRRSEEQARAHSGFQPRQWLDEALGEAGLRFSLAVVYFTLLPVLWPGQTVGKRLLGLQVAELSGKPMTLMRSFSRYGGYLASMGTGGVGFVQLVWDANRQALQDKAAHTVVLDLRRSDRLPGAEAAPVEPASTAPAGQQGAPHDPPAP